MNKNTPQKLNRKHSLKAHWEEVFATKDLTKVSWYQDTGTISLDLVTRYADHHDAIIDIGCGGNSRLLYELIQRNYDNLIALDLSHNALSNLHSHLGDQLTYIESSITEFEPLTQYSLWHDRAVLHFLTTEEEVKRYVSTLNTSLHMYAIAIIATFATDKKRTCSDLPTKGYDSESIQKTFGKCFILRDTRSEVHHTPSNDKQHFNYFVLQKVR